MANSTAVARSQKARSPKPGKPRKPHPDFPLTAHSCGKWCKKVKGRIHYFGKWSDPDGALAEWLDVKDDLLAGRTPRRIGGCTIRDACNHFLTAKQSLVDTSELTPRSFEDYRKSCARVVRVLGADTSVEALGPDDFVELKQDISKSLGLHAMSTEIQRIRTLFKYAYDVDLIKHPLKFGPLFRKPGSKVMRRNRKAQSKVFSASEVRKLLKHADVQLHAMILLGVNCAFGNHDVANLEQDHVDLFNGWLNFPRPKTGVDRRIPLWTETAEALERAQQSHKQAKKSEHGQLVFVTRCGNPWCSKNGKADSPVANEFAKLQKKCDTFQPRRGFYSLRHTFETVAGGCRDQVAVDAIMGHVDASMAATYRHSIDDSRLISVTETVHRWLFGTEGE